MSNKHKHYELISQWNDDNSIEFELAYGTGVDFTWHDCDITRVINSPLSQIRIKAKKPKKEKRWIGYCASRNQTFPHPQDSKELAWDYAARNYSYHTSEWQILEIEVEV